MMRRCSGVLLLAVLACGPDGRPFPETRVYAHSLFPTAEACELARQHGVINCEQWATFCANGRANLVFTDIVNSATYRVDDGIITVRFTGPGDAQAESMRFRLSADEESMTDVGGTRTWTRNPEAESLEDQNFCTFT